MKVRGGFVTNSSSSSFVIAKKEGCSTKDIQDILFMYRNEIVKILEDWYERELDDDEIQVEMENILSRLDYSKADIRLGEWDVTSQTFSNDCDAADSVIYELGFKFNSDNFKMA